MHREVVQRGRVRVVHAGHVHAVRRADGSVSIWNEVRRESREMFYERVMTSRRGRLRSLRRKSKSIQYTSQRSQCRGYGDACGDEDHLR